MRRETLLDFFDERLRSDAEFCVHDNGYRVRRYSYATVRRAALDFAARLAAGTERARGRAWNDVVGEMERLAESVAEE